MNSLRVKIKNNTGISQSAILSAFKGTNLRAIKPEIKSVDTIRQNALSSNEVLAKSAWSTILTGDNITKNYDFLVKNSTNQNLKKILQENAVLAKNATARMIAIYQSAKGLSEIQVKVLNFLKTHNLINVYEYEDAVKQITSGIIARNIDYISADQLCTLFRNHRDLNITSKLSSAYARKLNQSPYGSYLYSCDGIYPQKVVWSKAYECLINKENHDWACLTENPKNLDVSACVLAKSRNTDAENADDMMWFCYSKMQENNYLNKATCLELTHNFSLLGNQIKMNWNCLNRVRD